MLIVVSGLAGALVVQDEVSMGFIDLGMPIRLLNDIFAPDHRHQEFRVVHSGFSPQ